MSQKPSFSGVVAENYEKYFSPMFFTAPGRDIVSRMPEKAESILELACGTGQVTRFIKERYPGAEIIGTDLFQEMIEEAKRATGESRIEWKAMDAQDISFGDNIFDAVICQFGVMFFPDKLNAFKGILRVLKPGGVFIFSTWTAIENQHIAEIARDTIYSFFKENTPTFFSVPFSANDPTELEKLMIDAGFKDVSVKEVKLEGFTESAENAARGFTMGNPIYNDICARDESFLPEIFESVKKRFTEEYGEGAFKIPLSILVSSGTK